MICTETILEFDKVRNLWKTFALTEAAKEKIAKFKIGGSVIDKSSSGNKLFIEPTKAALSAGARRSRRKLRVLYCRKTRNDGRNDSNRRESCIRREIPKELKESMRGNRIE